MDARFSILTFPQRYDGARLHLRILLVPKLSTAWNGNPLLPVNAGVPNPGDTAPPFADADLQFEARILRGFDRFPVHAPVDLVEPLPMASGVAADARVLIEELVAPGPGRFRIDAGAARMAPKPKPEIFIQKYLPESYRNAFHFTGPRTRDALTNDAYACAVKKASTVNPLFVTTPDTVSWGQVYAYCLRHHQLARKLGLIREASFAVDPTVFEDGGFLHVGLTANSDYAAQIAADDTFVRRYAARIPRLSPAEPRPLFAAVQLPVVFDDPAVPGPPAAPGNFDAIFIEAAEYDDGFAKIVHGAQPVSQNLLAEQGNEFTPLQDIGVRLGWDDEQILIWQNRQLRTDTTVPMVNGEAQRLDAPMGVFGYRIDAREQNDPVWHSLVAVQSKAPLTLGQVAIGDDPNGLFTGELSVEVHPAQLDGNQDTGQYWLPMYMAQWSGPSMVLPDTDAARIFKTEQSDSKAVSLGRMYDPVGMDEIPLRYGHVYDFRVRFTDPTGGGPLTTDEPAHESPAPTATVHFRRHVTPGVVRVANQPTFPEAPLDALFPDDQIEILRPLLGYPNVVFTDKYADPIALLEAASDAMIGKEAFGIPDPDVRRVQIDVEVRALKMDNLLSLSGTEAWAKLYTTTRLCPEDFESALMVPMTFVDANVLRFGDTADLGDLGVNQDDIDARPDLVLPTSRDIRLTLRALGDDDTDYFANDAHVGKPIELRVRREAAAETGLFSATIAAKRIRGLYLRPDPEWKFDGQLSTILLKRKSGDTPAIVERLAQQIGVEHKGLTLIGKPGERVIFGCSRKLRHTLSPDNTSLTFASKEDLANHWIVALTLQLDRDWTWDGLRYVSAEIFRDQKFRIDVEVDTNGGRPVGDWEIIPTASIHALRDAQREHTTLIFLDAVEPKSQRAQAGDPTETRFPDIIDLEYRVVPRFSTPRPDATETLQLALPVTTPPTQVPRIVSAGLALSEYKRNEEYSATEPRRRALWVEFDKPPQDPNDAYFIRLLAYAPDPMLARTEFAALIAPEEPPLPIDPELMRVITPDEPDDNAGRSAMIQLEPSGDSDRHYLAPLPPGLNADSAELFGFFTYELRVGHANIWCTANGRFGRALRSTGVQHPAPTLFCTTQRDEQLLLVQAPYAMAVRDGRNVTPPVPRTEIWALLYAQVQQADGKDFRNILLDDRRMRPVPPVRDRVRIGIVALPALSAFQNSDAAARGITGWQQQEIRAMLRDLGLPEDSPLSVLCVEMMPTMSALQTNPNATQAENPGDVFNTGGLDTTGLTAALVGQLAGVDATQGGSQVRPLSDGLGHFRILRTSPLTEVAEVCCSC